MEGSVSEFISLAWLSPRKIAQLKTNKPTQTRQKEYIAMQLLYKMSRLDDQFGKQLYWGPLNHSMSQRKASQYDLIMGWE